MSENKLLTRDEYLDLIRGLEPGTCLFCSWERDQIVLAESKHWAWIVCLAPYWKYHTMFIPKNRHVEKIDDLKPEELEDLREIKKIALEKYKNAAIPLSDGTPARVFFYFWREREEGFDFVYNVAKSTHLHIHMAPQKDNVLDPVLDKDSTDFDYTVLL